MLLNKDDLQESRLALGKEMADALAKNDEEGVANAMQKFSDSVMESIEHKFMEIGTQGNDAQALAARGMRPLTTQENEWYGKLIKAFKSENPKQEITNISVGIPFTVIDRVLEDMKTEHPLLNAISFQNAAGQIRVIMNGAQMASKLGGWGVIASALATQIAGSISCIDVTAAKYTAYFIIPKDYTKFNFGVAPVWVDMYIRTMLSESMAFGLEKAIISGDGKNQPAGMIMDISKATSGAYSAKTAVALTDFDESYSAQIATLAKDDEGNDRTIPEVLLVVNPQDYIKKIRRYQNALVSGIGVVDLISNTYPTMVVASSMMEEGKAALGIAKNYFAALNGGVSGIVEFDDSAQFLEDNRLYTSRIYGNGQPVDNKSFVYLDISGVETPAMPVKVKGTVTTKASA